MSVQRILGIGFWGLVGATAVLAGSRPVAVSPGTAAGAKIGVRCPTFSWGGSMDAVSHELVVYRIGEEERLEPVLRERIPSPAQSWTPALARCLEWGGRYSWLVGTVGRDQSLQWSLPRFFEVTATPSPADLQEALEIVRAYLARVTEAEVAPAEAIEIPAPRVLLKATAERRAVEAFQQPLQSSAAIHAESPAETGFSHGVVAVSRSTAGAAVIAENTAGGTDLLLDGWNDGETSTRITQAGIYRTSAAPELFTIANPDLGTLNLVVEGAASASYFSGDGAGLSNVTASYLVCDDCVSSLHVVNNSLTGADIGPNAIDEDEIEDGAVRQAEIAANSVGNEELLDAAVQGAELGEIRAVYVECNGECTDRSGGPMETSLGMACDRAGTDWRPIALQCDTQMWWWDKQPCGGDNECSWILFDREQDVGWYCADTGSMDVIVFCIEP